jgi:hypothetical protein
VFYFTSPQASLFFATHKTKVNNPPATLQTSKGSARNAGDLVKAIIPRGKFRGAHQGRLAIRARGAFVVQTRTDNIETRDRHCTRLMRNDGYTYPPQNTEPFLPQLKQAVPYATYPCNLIHHPEHRNQSRPSPSLRIYGTGRLPGRSSIFFSA